MTFENKTQTPKTVQEKLVDPQVQEGLKIAFASMDEYFSKIKDETGLVATLIGRPSVTEAGVYVEARLVSTPKPEQLVNSTPENSKLWSAYHASTEYVVFAFDIQDSVVPDFAPIPVDISEARVYNSRGSGIDITFPDNRPDSEDMEQLMNAVGDSYIRWLMATDIHLPQTSSDSLVYFGVDTRPFKEVRKELGVEL